MRRPKLERRRRASARAALYGSLVLVAALAWSGVTYLARVSVVRFPATPWVGVDYASMPEVQLLQRYLRVDTSQPDADEVAGARFLAGELTAAGIPSTLEVLGGRHANLWAVLEGEDPRALVLHNHIDTDPVTHRELWRHAPDSGDIELPWIWGRGAYDMKSIAVAQLLAVIDLARAGRPLKRSVIFLATGSEEVGSDFGMKWLLAHRPELAGRFWAVLTEGGTVETRASHDEQFIKYWGIEFAQKRIVDVTLCSDRREPLEELRQELIEQRRSGDFAVRLTPEVLAFLVRYAPTRDHPDFPAWLADPRSLRLDARKFARLGPYLRALFRDEAPPFEVEAAPGGGYRLLVKFHLLPGSDFAAAHERLLPAWMTYGLETTLHDEGGAAAGSPLDHPVFLALQQAVERHYPEAPVGPLFLPWTATDSRFTRAAGIPSYGFSPFVVLSPETLRVGRINERIELPAYVEGVAMYRQVVQRLALAD